MDKQFSAHIDAVLDLGQQILDVADTKVRETQRETVLSLERQQDLIQG